LDKLSLYQIEHIFIGENQYSLSENQLKRVRESYNFLVEFSKGKVIYGINTGFGPMAQYRIDDREIEQLQYNLIHSHSNGTGDYIDKDYVRIAMICRLNTLALGFSGVSEGFIKSLEAFIHKDIIPCIPEHGGVGASGDLIQLAHMAQTLIGYGRVFYKGKIRKSSSMILREYFQPSRTGPII